MRHCVMVIHMCLCDPVCAWVPLTTFQDLSAPTATQVPSRMSVLVDLEGLLQQAAGGGLGPMLLGPGRCQDLQLLALYLGQKGSLVSWGSQPDCSLDWREGSGQAGGCEGLETFLDPGAPICLSRLSG